MPEFRNCASGNRNGGADASFVTTLYDALSRPTQVSDSGGGYADCSCPNNDVLVEVGPTLTGESTKKRQYEYDGL